MKVLFSGYRIAGYECLKYLIEQNANIIGVLTHDERADKIKIEPDKSVRLLALQHNIPIILDDNSLKNIVMLTKPDVHLSAFYKKKVPEEIIDMIPINTNIHGGRLPDYKGCFSPIWVILNEEKYADVTLQFMGKKIDSGDIIKVETIKINDDDTGKTLYYKITDVVIKLFKELYIKLKNGDKIKTYPQQIGGTYYNRQLPNDGFLDMNWSNDKKYNFIRALDFSPLEPAKMKIGNKIIYMYTTKK